MPDTGSVTRLIQGAAADDPVACHGLHEKFFQRLVDLARGKLRGVSRRVMDEEDVALSVLGSFLQGAREGRYPDLNDREGLWRLLVKITGGKAANQANYLNRDRRGGGKVLDEAALDAGDAGDDGFFQQIISREPTPEFAAQMAEDLEHLLGRLEKSLRQIAQWKLDGLKNGEIAAQLDCVPRTITRKLQVIRTIWEQEGLV